MVFNPSLIDVSRHLAGAESAGDYLLLAAGQLHDMLHSDNVLWVDTGSDAQCFVVRRAADQAHDQKPAWVMPDLSGFWRPAERAAVRLSREVLGARQLSLIIDVDPEGRGRGWIVTRRDSAFSDDDLAAASSLLPLLIAFDRLYRERPVRQGPLPKGKIISSRGGIPAPVPDSCLSAREQQVVDLLADGLTAHAIGTALGISPRTVGKHLEHIYAKVGHHDRLMVALHASSASRQPAPMLG